MGGSSGSPQVTTQRLPKANDPSLRSAQMRAQEAATKRTGRLSTMLTDTMRSLSGSVGKLGA